MTSTARLTEIPAFSLARDYPSLARLLSGCVAVAVYSIPLTRRFRRICVRDGLLLQGEAGWGEISPFWDYPAPVAWSWVAAGMEAAREGFPSPLRERVPVNATVPVCDPETAAGIVNAHPGVSAVKVKVADPGVRLADDCARVEAVRDALNARGGGAIRVDVNGAWDIDEAIGAIGELDRAAGGLEYVEQPVASVEELARLRRKIEVPVAADESVRLAQDPLDVVRAEACDLIVTKVQPLGGVRRALELAAQAGVPVVVSSAIDSSVGLSMGAHLAACLPCLPHACGLGTASLLTDDVTTRPLAVNAGDIEVRGVEADRTDLPNVEEDLVRAWLKRLEDIAQWREAQR